MHHSEPANTQGQPSHCLVSKELLYLQNSRTARNSAVSSWDRSDNPAHGTMSANFVVQSQLLSCVFAQPGNELSITVHLMHHSAVSDKLHS